MYQRHVRLSKGFALPTVLIASVVLLTVLAVSVSATSAIRTTLKNQYYSQLALIAGEAGVAYAKACLAANGNVPQWSNTKPLTPATDCAGNLQLGPAVQALIVAGGGSGGGATGGGGGGGGVLSVDSVPIVDDGDYTVTVGNGGAAPGNQVRGISGGNSSFAGYTAIGGGGGGHSANSTSGSGGYSGGSGGGGQNYYSSFASGAGTAGQGNAGGPLGTAAASGGGGAGGPGLAGVGTNIGGAGGPGIANSITGSTIYYGAGGGGGNGGAGGYGGGGAGGSTVGAAGRANTGSGGGGGWSYTGGNGGAGGSGVVIIAYPSDAGISATGGTYTNTSGLYTVKYFLSSGTFHINSAGTASCPTDPRCSVTVNDNVRSSFRVTMPTLDSTGKAVTIPYTGYTELTRASTGAVWRTFTQPSVQSAVVPDLCTADTTSIQGWNNATIASTQDAFGPSPSAETIAPGTSSAVYPGPIFYRKDFNVTQAGTYTVNVHTPNTLDKADAYIDGVKVLSTNGSLNSNSLLLAEGCHNITIEVTNDSFANRATRVTASVQRNGDINPVAATGYGWRFTTGPTAHFSSLKYYESPSVWVPVRIYNDPGWATNRSTRGITTPDTSAATGYAYFRDKRVITVTENTPITLGFACTNDCNLYLDGTFISSGTSSFVTTVNLTLSPGSHKFGMRQRNAGSVGYFYFGAFKTSDNSIISQSDANWVTNNSWTSTTDFNSYDATYLPKPNSIPTANVMALVVGGGGSGGGGWEGGGGGAGAMVTSNSKMVTIQNYPITVGAGGAGGSSTAFNNGGSSIFDDLFAWGGGAGAGEPNATMTYPMNGGSGGGGAHPTQTVTSSGFLTQGNKGGTGLSGNPYVGGGGGGAGAVGQNASTTKGGNGGAGYPSSITGSMVYYAAGGGGSFRGGTGGTGGTGGGGNGGTTGTAGTANTGSGGGAGSNPSGASGISGAGGSGVVIIAYRTGSISATGGTVTTSGNYTIHRFTSSGTFSVQGISTLADSQYDYDGLSGSYNAAGPSARLVVGMPLGSYATPLPFGGRDYDVYACYGAANCSPIDLIRGTSTSGTLTWVGFGPTGTVDYSSFPVTGQTVRYQLVAYGTDPNCADCLVSNIVPITIP